MWDMEEAEDSGGRARFTWVDYEHIKFKNSFIVHPSLEVPSWTVSVLLYHE